MQDCIVLVTDRHEHGRRVQRDLNLIRPCRLASPHKPLPVKNPAAIVSDVALDSPASLALLKATLGDANRGHAPLVCVLRKDTRREDVQADVLGAFDVVPADAPRQALVDAVVRAIVLRHEATSDRVYARARERARRVGLVVADMMDAAEDGAAIAHEHISQGASLVLRAVGEGGVKTWLDVVWRYDDVTYQHVLLVAGLTAAFARALGFSPHDARRVTEAALVHDVGKAGIPLEILNKPGRLTEAEMEVMKSHAVIGYDVLVAQGDFPDDVVAVVRSHHEYLDGTGYPDGLAGDAIPDLVRLVTVCDIYAALVERRPYREPLPKEEAFRIMREMGPKLDRDILNAFVTAIGAQT